VTYIGHELNSSSVELVHIFVMQPKFVDLETELIPAVEHVLLIPSLNFDGAVSPECLQKLFSHHTHSHRRHFSYCCH